MDPIGTDGTIPAHAGLCIHIYFLRIIPVKSSNQANGHCVYMNAAAESGITLYIIIHGISFMSPTWWRQLYLLKSQF